LPDCSSGCLDGERLDPLHDLRFLQALRLQELADFHDGAMDDRVSNRGAEKGGLELLGILATVRPFAARRGKSKSALVDIVHGVSSAEETSAMNPACAAPIGAGSAAARHSMSCRRRACSAADDMHWPWIGLNRHSASRRPAARCDRAGSRQIAFEPWKDLAERFEAAGEQTVGVPILGCAGPRSGESRQAVAFKDLDPLKKLCQGAGHRQPANSRADYYRACPQDRSFGMLRLVRNGQITAGRLR
jgi:hypothetical protein